MAARKNTATPPSMATYWLKNLHHPEVLNNYVDLPLPCYKQVYIIQDPDCAVIAILFDKQVYTAIAKIPTVQLLYSARPLAVSIAFGRGHVKFLFVCLAFLVIFTQPGIIYSHLPPPLPAHRFRFR